MSNLVLAGFMATGKTSVGRQVAARLGWDFVDTDAIAEKAAGATIAQIFARGGEQEFRALESQAVARAAALDRTVIAVGGGALLEPLNRLTLEATSCVLCLDADAATIARRTDRDRSRPLLNGDERANRISALLTARREHYASLARHVDTNGRTVHQVADEVIATLRAWQETSGHYDAVVPVPIPGNPYGVRIGHGLLGRLGGLLRCRGIAGRVAIVTPPLLRRLYGPAASASLDAAGFASSIIAMPDGEDNKTLATVSSLYQGFVEAGLDRTSTVIALGGGVVGDVAGFAAATYLRGIAVVQVPTTLLAMVDASIGGKTAVDLPAGKNLVGAFHQPRLVVCDVDVLASLPDRELRAGMAEVVKTALLADPELLTALETMASDASAWPLAEIVRRAAVVKARVIAADPGEQGERITLNLGHTIGHAVEHVSGFTYRHGEAVSIGLVGAARLAAVMNIAERSLVERTEGLLRRLGLPTVCPGLDPGALRNSLLVDKKRRQGRVRWVLPVRPGEVKITDEVPEEGIAQVLQALTGSVP